MFLTVEALAGYKSDLIESPAAGLRDRGIQAEARRDEVECDWRAATIREHAAAKGWTLRASWPVATGDHRRMTPGERFWIGGNN